MLEDDVEFASDMTAILQGEARILHLETTLAACAHLLRNRPDLLWLDLDLSRFFSKAGELEGLAFLRLVRTRLDPDLPVLIVSGRLHLVGEPIMKELDVMCAVGKPPDLGELRRVLDLVRRRRIEGSRKGSSGTGENM